MADTQEPKTAEQTIDPAALAFEALREEVALARRAVAGLAAERASIEIPDYSESLGKIMQSSAATAKTLRALTEVPILHATVRTGRAQSNRQTPRRDKPTETLSRPCTGSCARSSTTYPRFCARRARRIFSVSGSFGRSAALCWPASC